VACALLGVWPAAAEAAFTGCVRVSDEADRALSIRPAAATAGVREPAPLPFLDGRFCPLEERLFDDAGDGRLEDFSPLAAALVASGVEDAQVLQRYEQRQTELLEELRGSGKLAGPPRQQAQVVFEFMHRRLLTAGYRTDGTDLRAALDQGRFNCVSASVLFNCLAGELGLPVCGLEIPGHAMSRLLLADGPLDVETTCPGWFQLLEDPRQQAEMVAKAIGPGPGFRSAPTLARCPASPVTNFRSVPTAGERSQAREVSPAEMAAMIYYNRGVDLLAEKHFEQSAAANAKALRLDPQSATARGNLLATINNWAISLGSSERYAEAVDLLRAGLKLDPGYETFVPNYVHVHHQWVEGLCRSGRFEEALQVLARAAVEMPGQAYFQQAACDVYRRWARTLLTPGEAEGEFAAFAEPRCRRGACHGLIEAESHDARR
jgi:pentatricopeptide repeat protein